MNKTLKRYGGDKHDFRIMEHIRKIGINILFVLFLTKQNNKINMLLIIKINKTCFSI